MTTLPLGASLRRRLRLDRKFRSLPSLGWPALGGISLALIGLLLMGNAYRLRVKEHDIRTESTRAERTIPSPRSVHVRALPAVIPSTSSYNVDLTLIFDIAKSQGIVLTRGDYRDAERTTLPVDVRIVDLRFNESYVKLKEFLATVLNTMPHVAVQELRIERKDSLTTRHQVLLEFALVYKSEETKRQLQPQSPQPTADRLPVTGKDRAMP